jgi:PPE-repeat protein
MNFSVLPPEVNSARMYVGEGSGPMLAAAAAWDGLAGELGSAAASFGSVTSALASESWQGAASAAMTSVAARYVGFLNTAATQADGAATQAKATAAAFEAARGATVHPALVSANRTHLVSLVTSNLFGQNAPAIAATEANYEQMWAQDVEAMAGYHVGASAAAGQLGPGLQALNRDFWVSIRWYTPCPVIRTWEAKPSTSENCRSRLSPTLATTSMPPLSRPRGSPAALLPGPSRHWVWERPARQ